MINVILGLEKLGKKYKFDTIIEDDNAILLTENTSGEDVEWIVYNIKEDTISYLGNTDNCNIWLYETRKDFTPDIIIEFIKDLNKTFELEGIERIMIKDLVDPKDWQEIAGIEAYNDERFINL